jgi:hypothetical protein
LRAEGFSCSWDVLDEGLGIGKLQFLILTIFFFSCKFFFSPIFGHHNSGSGSVDIQPKMLDPDPDLKSINPDLKHNPAIAMSTRIIKSASVIYVVASVVLVSIYDKSIDA